MNETLLAETLGEDTTTQLYRDADGRFRVRVMALPEGGGEKLAGHQSPHVYQDRPVSEPQARALFRASAAQRHVEAELAFAPRPTA